MDLQAAQMMKGRRATLTRIIVVVCFALAGVLMIGSLASPAKQALSALAS